MVLGGLVSEPEATSFGRRWNGVGGRREGITWCGKLESLVKWRMFGKRVGVWPRLSKQAVKVVLEIRLFLLLMEGNWSCSWSRWSRNALHDKIGFVSVLQWQVLVWDGGWRGRTGKIGFRYQQVIVKMNKEQAWPDCSKGYEIQPRATATLGLRIRKSSWLPMGLNEDHKDQSNWTVTLCSIGA
jgi:hypothetical protein